MQSETKTQAKMTTGRFVRLPKDLDHKIKQYADKNAITMSYAIRRFCEIGIYNLSKNN